MATHTGRRLLAIATAALLALTCFVLWADPVLGQTSDQSQKEGMAYIECEEERTTTSTRPVETTTTIVETTTTAAEPTTTVAETTTTVEDEVLPTEVTTTTIEDEVLNTEVTAPSTVVASTLPFTGAAMENLAMLAMTLVAIGALVVVALRGSRVQRGRHVRR